MTLTERIRGFFIKQVARYLTIAPPWVRHSFLDPTFDRLASEALKSNSAVFACVAALAMAGSEPPIRVARGGKVQADHPLRRALRNPNPDHGEDWLIAATFAWLALGGNAFWHKLRDSNGRWIGNRVYHSGLFSAIPSQTGPAWVMDFLYTPPGASRGIKIPAEDVIHFRWPVPDPVQPWQGLPPLRAAARDVDTDSEITRYIFALLKNDAVPRLLLTMRPSVRPMDETERREAENEFTDQFGDSRRGGVMVLDGVESVERLAFDLKELAASALYTIPETRIAAALRTPAIVAGLESGLARSTFANYAEAREAWTDQTLAPLWAHISGEIERAAAGEFPDGGDLDVYFDMGKVSALADKRREYGLRGYVGGLLTREEGRVYAGWSDPPVGEFREQVESLSFLGAGPAQAQTKTIESKAEGERRIASQFSAIRKRLASGLERDLSVYFSELAAAVASRARRLRSPSADDADRLIESDDDLKLGRVVRLWGARVIAESWTLINALLDQSIDFSLADPDVSAALRNAGTRVRGITDATREKLREVLIYGNENGWSIDQLVDGAGGRPGIRSIVTETYQNRARAIARTELGYAQNDATAARYRRNGIEQVRVYDNGQDDPDEPCRIVNGSIQSIEWAQANQLQHPNCTRAFAPILPESD